MLRVTSVSIITFEVSLNYLIKKSFYLLTENARARVRVRGYVEPQNNQNFVRFKRIQVKITIPEAKFNLDNLFNGDPVLNQLGNRVVNENSDIFLAELVPGLELSLSERFTDIVNQILKNATYEDMFPSS